MSDEPVPEVERRRRIAGNFFFDFFEDDLRLPDGGGYTYYLLESHHEAAVVVPVLDDGRLVLERIYRHPYRRWLWEFPAGGIEAGESPTAAAARELAEETGLRAGTLDTLGAIEAIPGIARLRLHFVLARDLAESGAPLARETLEWMRVEAVTYDRARALASSEGEPVSAFLQTGLLFYERWLREAGDQTGGSGKT